MSRLSLKNDFKDGEILYGKELNTNNDATVAAVNDNYEKIIDLQDLKADVSDVTNKLATKVDVKTFNDTVSSINSTKADKSELATKADKSELATKADKSELQQGLSLKADITYVNNQLEIKANKSDVNNSLALKADKTDTYTKDETTAVINNAISNKADKTELNNKANKSDLGDLSDLITTNKSSAVAAINEIKREGSEVSNIDNLSISKNNSGAIQTIGVINRNDEDISIKTWAGTKDEYDSLETKDANTLYYITDDSDSYELVSNKVNTIDASSTNEQYPSAKAVYDSIQGIAPGGSNDYNDLNNKPQINGVTLQGNLSNGDLGIKQTYTANDIAFTDGETFQQKYDAGELTGPQGDTGAQGPAGTDGNDATINGQNAINLVAGENIDIAQDGSNVTISSTGGSGGATYTAGTNIEITEDNVINNTIPFRVKDDVFKTSIAIVGNDDFNLDSKSILIGDRRSTCNGYYSVVIGNLNKSGSTDFLIKNNFYSVVIGYGDTVDKGSNVVVGAQIDVHGENNVVLGAWASSDNNNCVVLGKSATSDKENQFVLGSTKSPINEMKVVTSDGDKYIATTDQTVPAGGTTGQVLMKNSNTDYDFSWTSLTNYDEVSF